uniref:RRM domain-containing protein n=1 Tax=Amphiprion percula TaxID=161767 RepID=A0A3P8S268_AMPPE
VLVKSHNVIMCCMIHFTTNEELIQACRSRKEAQLKSLEERRFESNIQTRIDGDNRSVCVGNVDYGATADEFSGHPSGFAYIEFSDRDSVHCAIGLHETLFRGRVLKVMPKRTNMPRISTTDRGGHRGGHSRGRGPVSRIGRANSFLSCVSCSRTGICPWVKRCSDSTDVIHKCHISNGQGSDLQPHLKYNSHCDTNRAVRRQTSTPSL